MKGSASFPYFDSAGVESILHHFCRFWPNLNKNLKVTTNETKQILQLTQTSTNANDTSSQSFNEALRN